MDAIETIEYRGFKINIYPDEIVDATPRDWNNLCTMTCFHQKYNLGDKHELKSDMFKNWQEIRDHLIAEGSYLIQPLYMLDHSGLTIRMRGFGDVDPQSWDWGQIGYIWVDRKKILKELNCKRITSKIRELVKKIMEAEVDVYNQYLSGEIYGYVIEPSTGDYDSIWGFYGDDHEKSGLMESARETIDSWHEETEEMRTLATMEEVGCLPM